MKTDAHSTMTDRLDLCHFIETILVYKLPRSTRERSQVILGWLTGLVVTCVERQSRFCSKVRSTREAQISPGLLCDARNDVEFSPSLRGGRRPTGPAVSCVERQSMGGHRCSLLRRACSGLLDCFAMLAMTLNFSRHCEEGEDRRGLP